jgi:hypothetical protein
MRLLDLPQGVLIGPSFVAVLPDFATSVFGLLLAPDVLL